MEIECFILVACPENSLIDAKVRRDNHQVYRYANFF
jgi:diphthamide biosynthesis protein 2